MYKSEWRKYGTSVSVDYGSLQEGVPQLVERLDQVYEMFECLFSSRTNLLFVLLRILGLDRRVELQAISRLRFSLEDGSHRRRSCGLRLIVHGLQCLHALSRDVRDG